MIKYPAIQLFNDLLAPSPSGAENKVADIIKDKLNELGYTPIIDPAGNLVVSLNSANPNAPAMVFAAHMDEIGMVVTRVEKNGTLKITRSGGLHPWKLGEGAVDIFGDRGTIKGVLSMGSTHTKKTAKKAITWEDVKILTGYDAADLKELGVRPGSPLLPVKERRGPVLIGPPEDPMVGAWTFDDRMGCVTLLMVLEMLHEQEIQPNYPTVIGFTTREEIGGHGAKYLVKTYNPEIFISVDGCPMPPEAPLELDGRPGIWAKDRIAIYNSALIQAFSKAAIEAGTELQAVVYEQAASDASLVSYALGVPKIACIGHVRDNSHGYEVARVSVFDNLLNTLVYFLKSYNLEHPA